MLVRLIKNKEGEVNLLCKDGSFKIPTMTVLTNFLLEFKNAQNFHGDDGFWNKDYADMSVVPGETLAFVADSGNLIINDFSVFAPLLKETYEIKNYISTTEYAEKVNMSVEIIKVLLRQGRITGAHKIANRWMIPEDAPYPIPPRSRKKKRNN